MPEAGPLVALLQSPSPPSPPRHTSPAASDHAAASGLEPPAASSPSDSGAHTSEPLPHRRSVRWPSEVPPGSDQRPAEAQQAVAAPALQLAIEAAVVRPDQSPAAPAATRRSTRQPSAAATGGFSMQCFSMHANLGHKRPCRSQISKALREIAAVHCEIAGGGSAVALRTFPG